MSETISYPILDEAIVVLENNRGIKVEVQGYTDSTGTAEYNLGLSRRRAEAVESYLEGKGVDSGVVSAKGCGAANPVTTNDTPAGRAQNRRAEFRAAE